MCSEYPNEYGQQDVGVISFHNSPFPETPITNPRTPPFRSHTSQSDSHCHTCDCGTVFGCEMACGLGDEQQCECCETCRQAKDGALTKEETTYTGYVEYCLRVGIPPASSQMWMALEPSMRPKRSGGQ